jgi:hypothetical protein
MKDLPEFKRDYQALDILPTLATNRATPTILFYDEQRRWPGRTG